MRVSGISNRCRKRPLCTLSLLIIATLTMMVSCVDASSRKEPGTLPPRVGPCCGSRRDEPSQVARILSDMRGPQGKDRAKEVCTLLGAVLKTYALDGDVNSARRALDTAEELVDWLPQTNRLETSRYSRLRKMCESFRMVSELSKEEGDSPVQLRTHRISPRTEE